MGHLLATRPHTPNTLTLAVLAVSLSVLATNGVRVCHGMCTCLCVYMVHTSNINNGTINNDTWRSVAALTFAKSKVNVVADKTSADPLAGTCT